MRKAVVMKKDVKKARGIGKSQKVKKKNTMSTIQKVSGNPKAVPKAPKKAPQGKVNKLFAVITPKKETKTTKSESKNNLCFSPSPYERNAIREIHAWKNPEIGWFGKAMTSINKPLNQIGDAIFEGNDLGDLIRKSIEGIIKGANDFAHWSIRPGRIYRRFQDRGHTHISSAEEVFSLDLQSVDEIVGYLDAKYKGIALVEGGGTGITGAPGLVVDIPALITLNLRAIGEYATHYGFDIQLQDERLFALNILTYSSSPSDSAKSIALAQLVRIAKDVAKKRAWKTLEQETFVQIIKQIAKTLGIRLTKAKLGQILPVAGFFVGAGFNSYYTAKVCDAAYYFYRERFLAEKYGEEFIEQTVPPAENYEPEYEEVAEEYEKF